MKNLGLLLIALTIGLLGCIPIYQQNGYATEADYNFAKTLGNPTPERINYIKSYGITSRPDFDKLLADMKSDKYSTETDLVTVMWYLRDRKDAKAAGLGVVEQKDARLKAQKVAADKAAAEEKQRRIEFAKNYPFEAILSCEMDGENFGNIAVCFSGNYSNSELKLTNGSEVRVYKIYELQQLGEEQQDGLHIPLKRNFAISAQNSSEYSVLRLKIINYATREVLNDQAAGKWDVVAIRN
jgi:hypothetical protein